MARLQTETNVKRFAVWRVDGNWHVLSAGELEAVGIMDLSTYEPEPPRIETWFGEPLGIVLLPPDRKKQRVMVHDTATETYYALFYLGDYEAISSSIPTRDYLRFGSANWPDFDKSLVYPAMEAVKAYQTELKEKQEAERKFREIQDTIEKDWYDALMEAEQQYREARDKINEQYQARVEATRRDLGLPPKSNEGG